MPVLASNITETEPREYSPLTLALEWPKMGRLLFMVGCCTLGSIMNGFFVATFFVESSLRKVGNVFLACVGLADLILTTIVIPSCAVVLLSGEWDLEPVCYALQFLAEASIYSYNIFFALVAMENYIRICRDTKKYSIYMTMNVGIIAVLVFIISFGTAGVGVYLDYDYNYCTRAHFGNLNFRIVTAIIFQGIPFVISIVSLIAASIRVRRKARKHFLYKRSHQFDHDFSYTALNISVYICFVVAWLPYVIIVNEYPDSSDAKFYHSVWLGLTRSVLTSFLYAFFNRNFRRAFAHLFNYCCCKNTLSSSFSSRHRRTFEYRPAISDVRVHIMHQAILVNSAPRYSGSSREIREL